MAARKLKFKPKPLIGGAVRRLREKEEIPELMSQELHSKQQICDIASLSSVKVDESSLSNEQDISEISVSKRMKMEQCRKSIEPPLNNTMDETSEPSCSPIPISVVTSRKIHYKSVSELESLDPDTNQSIGRCTNISGYSLSTQDCTGESESGKIISADMETDSPMSPKPSRTFTDTKSNLKKDTIKESTRFIRSKFKPVLNNNVPRKKTEIDYNNDNSKSDVYSIAIVRKEPVIKDVLETNKSNIVSEITESFSALESEECNFPLEIQTKDNELSKNTSRISIDVDIETNMSITDGNEEVDLLNTVNITESNRNESETTKSIPINETDSEKCNQLVVGPLKTSEIPYDNISTKVPVSPLKLTSKILAPKPCPNLLDTTARRISFHGSDSEEEPKCKIYLGTNKLGKKTKKEKDTKNNKRKLSQGSTYSKLGQEALEKFTQKFGNIKNLEPTDKAKLTMLDLIFYNPKTNPMTVNEPTVRKSGDKCEINEILKETLAEQSIDDVDEVETSGPAVPVPQLKVGPDGQIMLDPNSLIIETTEVKEKRAVMEKSEVIRETGITRYNTYSKKKHSRKDWSAQETLQFYKALNTIGTDFTLMTKLFPKRSRHELKLKFKKEERINLNLVDKAMTAPADFDFSSLEEEMKRENEEIARLEEEKKLAVEAAKKVRAQRKEEKGKPKGKEQRCSRLFRMKGSAFKDFDEDEMKKIKTLPSSKKKKSAKRKQSAILIASSSEEELPISIDLDSDEADLEESELKLLRMIREKTRDGSRRSLRSKETKTLKYYEEINQTLKRKLEEIDSESSDGYTPNGIDADMLFGSPLNDPFPDNASQEVEGCKEGVQWNKEVTSDPGEDNVLINIANMKSQTDPLGQCVTASDLSFPARKVVKACEKTDSVVNRHVISESIQIIDQLTSTVNINGNCNSSVASDEQSKDLDSTENCSDQELNEKCILPCSRSAGYSHISEVNLVQDSNFECDKTSAVVNDGKNPSGESNDCTGVGDVNKQGIVLPHYGTHSEECILGE